MRSKVVALTNTRTIAGASCSIRTETSFNTMNSGALNADVLINSGGVTGDGTLGGGKDNSVFCLGDDRDTITDFRNVVDTIELDVSLWGGGPTISTCAGGRFDGR